MDVEWLNSGPMSPASLNGYKLNCVAAIGVRTIGAETRVIMCHFL